MKYANRVNIESVDTHSVILSKVNPGTRIVEFGTSRGYMTNYLTNILGCEVIGFEIDEEAANVAADFASEMYVCDINNIEFWEEKLLGRKFDYIIFADVLEHIDRPDTILDAAGKFLSEEGKIIVSIPNNTHNSVLIDIYNDELTARSNGLLDNTHKHFMSQGKMEKFIRDSGLNIEEMINITIPPYKTELFNDYSMVPNDVAKHIRDRKNGEVYQFVFILTKHTVDVLNIDTAEVGDYLELFWKGSGNFTVEKSIRKAVSWGQKNSYKFLIQTDEPFNCLRLDPSAYRGLLEIENITINGSRYDIGDNNYNNVIYYGGVLASLSSDPQIFIDIPDHNNVEIEIDINYLKRIRDLNELISIISDSEGCSSNLKSKLDIQNNFESLITQLNTLRDELKNKDQWICKIESDILNKDKWIEKLNVDLNEKNQWIKKISYDLDRVNSDIGLLHSNILDKDKWIDKLNSDILEKDKWIETLTLAITEKDKWINKLESDIKEKDSWTQKLQQDIDELKNNKSLK